MIVVGLTGSIAMGKTTAANMLRDMGIPVHCSDQAVHDLLDKGGAAVAPVRELFPQAYAKDGGYIDRGALAEILDMDHERWDALEKVLHPMVRKAQQIFLREQQLKGFKMVVLDIPLLFETGADKNMDYVVVVTAPEFLQKQRVLARGKMNEEKFEFILSRQTTDGEKRARSDFVVQSGNGMHEMRRDLQQIVNQITEGRTPRRPQPV